MSWLLVACLMTPLLSAAASFIAPRGGSQRATVATCGTALLVALAAMLLWQVSQQGVISAQMGGWSAPFGISLVADPLAALLLLVSAAVTLAITLFAADDVDAARSDAGFHGFVQVILTGVVGALLTGDVFNLYVWFEVMLIGSFALMTLGADRVQLDGAVKYIALNLVATVLLLTAIGLLHAMAGTLNFADLHRVMIDRPQDGMSRVVATFFLVAFGIKAALFPVFAWLPAAYHTVPITVAALFAALMTKIGVYSLFRVGSLVFSVEMVEMRALLTAVAVATLVVGLAGAIAEHRLRRLLAWHVMVSVGILLLGVALGTELALAAAFLYFVHGMLAKAALFMVIGMAERHGAGEHIREVGGLQRLSPWLAAAFLFSALSLIGLPPTPGFWAKLAFVKAGLDAGSVLLVVAVLLAGLLSFLPLMRLWNEMFWKAAPEPALASQTLAALASAPGATPPGRPMQAVTLPAGMVMGLAGLTLVSVLIGLAPASLYALAADASASVIDPSTYVQAVLGEAGDSAAMPMDGPSDAAPDAMSDAPRAATPDAIREATSDASDTPETSQ